MTPKESEILAFIDELVEKGERLSKIVYRAYDNPPDSSVFVVGAYAEFPAPQAEYSQWDTDCQILVGMLGGQGRRLRRHSAVQPTAALKCTAI